MSFYYLIDFENVREMGISSLPPTESTDHIYVFYTDNAAKLNMDAMLGHDAELKFIKVAAGKQSLDMHLVSVLGFLLRDRGGENEYIVVSRDNGFDNVINFWKSKGFAVGRHTANAPVPEAEERVEKPEEKKKNRRNRKDPSEKKNGRRKKEKQEASLAETLADSGIPAPEAYAIAEEIEAELPLKKEENLIDEELPFTFDEEPSMQEEQEEPSVKEEIPSEEIIEEESVAVEEPEEVPETAEEPETEPEAVEEVAEEPAAAEEPEAAPAEAAEENVETAEVAEEAAADTEKEVKKEVDPHTLMNNKLMGLLRNKLDANTLGAIASIVIRNMDMKNYKQVIYRSMVKKFGQKQGLEYYNMIKKEI